MTQIKPINIALPISPTEDYYNLGSYTRPITTDSKAAQIWFDRGLTWCYGFNHVEGRKCFEQAIAHDPQCAIAYWGIAYAAGPNYNKAWGIFDRRDLENSVKLCYDSSSKAEQLISLNPVTPAERYLIKAIRHRYPSGKIAQGYDVINHAYDASMKEAYTALPEDLDIMALYVDAKMMIAQRKMFDIHTGLPVETSPVYDIQKLFRLGMQHPQSSTHPGLLHFSIHFWEMSATPAIALPGADYLSGLVPDAGHLHHMPSHLYVLVGAYQKAVTANAAAVEADDKYLAREGAKNMYSFYRLHNHHSLVYAAMLGGQSNIALQAIDPMEASLTDHVLRVESPPLADWLEFFKSVRVHVYIRFGMWEQLKALPLPQDQNLYCVTTVMTYYGKGIAYAATGDVDEADKQRELYHAAAKLVPDTRRDYPNRIVDILEVATAMLDGEIEYRKGNFERAFTRLRDAIKLDDGLRYTEPWGWMVPTRHAYAALSLEQGRVEQAAKAYAEDLGLDSTLTRAHQHPNNVWSLHGYYECLKRLHRSDEADIIKEKLYVALGIADIEIRSSCFCRVGETPAEQGDRDCCR